MESIFYHDEFSNLTHFQNAAFSRKKLITFTLFYFCQIRIVTSQFFYSITQPLKQQKQHKCQNFSKKYKKS